MKIYSVTRGVGWDFELLGIFSERQKADAFANAYTTMPLEQKIRTRTYWNGIANVDEYEVDSPIPKYKILNVCPLS